MCEYVFGKLERCNATADRKQLWKVENNGEDRKVTYLSTLVKHTQAVNVVRWSPRGLSKLSKCRQHMLISTRRSAGYSW